MKKIWYEAYVQINGEKSLHCFGKNSQRKFKTYVEAVQVIAEQKLRYYGKDTTMRRDGKEYHVSFADTHNIKFSIAKFEADVEEEVVDEIKADEKLKAMYDGVCHKETGV